MSCLCLQRTFGDLVGSRIVDAVAATLLGLPRNRLVIDAIAANPLWRPVLGAASAVAGVVAPIERTALVGHPIMHALPELVPGQNIFVGVASVQCISHSSSCVTICRV